MVGGIDAGGIIDGVGIQPATLQTVFNARALSHAQIGALANHLAAQGRGIDTQRIVGAVAGVHMGFAGRLHIGADTAEPQQIHLRRQHRLEQFRRGQFVRLDIEQLFHLGRNIDRLGAPLDHPATLRDQLGVVVGPATARQVEQPCTFGEALFHVRVGIDENMQMVEGADQPNMLAEQHAVAEHVARHVADTHYGKVL